MTVRIRLFLCLSSFLLLTPLVVSRAQEAGELASFPGAPTPIPEEARQKLEDSYAKWLEAKTRSGGNYSYQVVFSSFVGFRSTTTITATRCVVSRRAYEEYFPPFFEFEPKNYVEEEDEIGTNSRGAPPLTIEELYEIARQVLNQPLAPYVRLVLNFDDQDLLKNCFTYNSLIADDVPINGVRITNLTLLPRIPGASDCDSDEDFDQEISPDPATVLRIRIKRLKFALKNTKRFSNPRQKRIERKRIRQRLRKLSATLG